MKRIITEEEPAMANIANGNNSELPDAAFRADMAGRPDIAACRPDVRKGSAFPVAPIANAAAPPIADVRHCRRSGPRRLRREDRFLDLSDAIEQYLSLL